MKSVNSNSNLENSLSLDGQEISKEDLINTVQGLKRLSTLMKNHRAERDMGYREYSALFGDLSPNISAIEKCQLIRMPSVETLSKFADILGIEFSELIKYLQYGGNLDQVLPKVTAVNVRASIRLLNDHEEVIDCLEDLLVQLLKTRPRREKSDDSGF